MAAESLELTAVVRHDSSKPEPPSSPPPPPPPPPPPSPPGPPLSDSFQTQFAPPRTDYYYPYPSPTGRIWTSSPSEALPLRHVRNNINSEQTSPVTLNPIAKAFRDQELGKVLLGWVMPLSTFVLAVVVYTKDPLPLLLLLLAICIAPVALMYGIGLRNEFPRIANAVEQFGFLSFFFPFYAAVSKLLPPYYDLIPWACFLFIVVLSAWSCIPF